MSQKSDPETSDPHPNRKQAPVKKGLPAPRKQLVALGQLPGWQIWRHSSYKNIAIEGQHLRYIGPGLRDRDAASVRSQIPAPVRNNLCYFEIKVVNKGLEGFIGIGFSKRSVALGRLPGWEPDSYGYHGDDGCVFHNSGRGRPWGPTFGTGDVIGALLDKIAGTISYTKNGEFLGVAFTDVWDTYLYPTVGLRTPNEEVLANFGSRPFMAKMIPGVNSGSQAIFQNIRALM